MPKKMAAEKQTEMIRILKLSLAPLPRTEIVRELLKLKVKTNSRNMDVATLELQLEVYADELAKFPADCVLQALKDVGRQKWWPEWGQLERMLSPLEVTRRGVLRAVEGANKRVKPDRLRGCPNGAVSTGQDLKRLGDLMPVPNTV
ncbi:hypothetical protein [Kiloniella antarctica]|uniref:Integrase n=1 Tax=Kiloniella antarctica TaxID=1550907 RepID=A0ABW5BLV1_9PROT